MQRITSAICRGARKWMRMEIFPNTYCVGGSYGVKSTPDNHEKMSWLQLSFFPFLSLPVFLWPQLFFFYHFLHLRVWCISDALWEKKCLGGLSPVWDFLNPPPITTRKWVWLPRRASGPIPWLINFCRLSGAVPVNYPWSMSRADLSKLVTRFVRHQNQPAAKTNFCPVSKGSCVMAADLSRDPAGRSRQLQVQSRGFYPSSAFDLYHVTQTVTWYKRSIPSGYFESRRTWNEKWSISEPVVQEL